MLWGNIFCSVPSLEYVAYNASGSNYVTKCRIFWGLTVSKSQCTWDCGCSMQDIAADRGQTDRPTDRQAGRLTNRHSVMKKVGCSEQDIRSQALPSSSFWLLAVITNVSTKEAPERLGHPSLQTDSVQGIETLTHVDVQGETGHMKPQSHSLTLYGHFP